MATNNATNTGNPVIVSQGGTGLATLTTAYGVVCAGTTATGVLQNAGAGTSGQVFTSQGASALPTWSTNSAVGGFVLIGTATASNSSAITFTGLTTAYAAYKLIIYNVTGSSAGASFLMRCSTNNGSSYDSGNSYQWSNLYLKNNSAPATSTGGSSSDTNIAINGNSVSATGGQTVNVEINFYAPAASVTQAFSWIGQYFRSADGWYQFSGGGTYNTQAVNALQFLMSANNINTGTFKLYGLVAT